MDTKSIIKKLNGVFCENSKKDKVYTQVWLSDVDFGGLYHNDMFILNVKADHQIDSCYQEIKHVVDLLDKEAKEELKHIWRVVVYNSDEEAHCWSEDELVFDKANSCP